MLRPPAAKLGDQDCLDLAGPSEREDLGTLGARCLGTRRRLLEHRRDLVASTSGERP